MLFNKERVLTREEVREELAVLRGDKVFKGALIGCGVGGLLLASPTIDAYVFKTVSEVANQIITFLCKDYMFLGCLGIPNYYLLFSACCFFIYMYCEYKEVKGRKSK